MKILPSGAAGGLPSGSAGALTASHNRYGYYLRSRVIPTNPNTTRQQNVRSAFATLANSWANVLTPVQRTSWDTWAANVGFTDSIGSTIYLTGQAAYIRANVPRLNADLDVVDDAPTVFNNGEPITGIKVFTDQTIGEIGVDLAGTGLAIQAFTGAVVPVDGDILLYFGAPVNVTRSFFKGPYQLAAIGDIALGSTGGLFQDLLVDLLSDNTEPEDGQYRGVKLVIAYDDGRLTLPYHLLAPVTADSA